MQITYNENVKVCKDCLHFRAGSFTSASLDMCTATKTQTIDVISGKIETTYFSCETERRFGICNKQAKLFVPKEKKSNLSNYLKKIFKKA